jgi:hypothetical protein
LEQDLQTGDIRPGALGVWRFAQQCSNMP